MVKVLMGMSRGHFASASLGVRSSLAGQLDDSKLCHDDLYLQHCTGKGHFGRHYKEESVELRIAVLCI